MFLGTKYIAEPAREDKLAAVIGEGIIAEPWDGDPDLSWQDLYRVCKHLLKADWMMTLKVS